MAKKIPGRFYCVYFAQSPSLGDGIIKIGQTSQIHDRLKNLSGTNLPFPYELVKIIISDYENYKDLEKKAHAYFDEKRLSSKEFFNLSKNEIDVFCREYASAYTCLDSLDEYDEFCSGSKKKESELSSQDGTLVAPLKNRIIVTDYYKDSVLCVFSPTEFLPLEKKLYGTLGGNVPMEEKTIFASADTLIQRIAQDYVKGRGLSLGNNRRVLSAGYKGTYTDIHFENLAVMSDEDIQFWKGHVESKENSLANFERTPGQSIDMFKEARSRFEAMIDLAGNLLSNSNIKYVWNSLDNTVNEVRPKSNKSSLGAITNVSVNVGGLNVNGKDVDLNNDTDFKDLQKQFGKWIKKALLQKEVQEAVNNLSF